MKRERGAGGLTNESGSSAGRERGKRCPLLYFLLRTLLPQAIGAFHSGQVLGTRPFLGRRPERILERVGGADGSTLHDTSLAWGGRPPSHPGRETTSAVRPTWLQGGSRKPTPYRLSIAEPRPTSPGCTRGPSGNLWFPRVHRPESGSQTLAGMGDRAPRPRNRHRPLPPKKPSLCAPEARYRGLCTCDSRPRTPGADSACDFSYCGSPEWAKTRGCLRNPGSPGCDFVSNNDATLFFSAGFFDPETRVIVDTGFPNRRSRASMTSARRNPQCAGGFSRVSRAARTELTGPDILHRRGIVPGFTAASSSYLYRASSSFTLPTCWLSLRRSEIPLRSDRLG